THELSCHDVNRAPDPGGRRLVRHPRIPGLELPRTLAGRRDCCHLLDGSADAVPEDLASETGVDEHIPRRRDRVVCASGSRCSTAWLLACPGPEGVDAMGHSQ